MNRHTKNDLSFNTVRLDYAALTSVSSIAVSAILREIERKINAIRSIPPVSDTELHMAGESLANLGAQMAVATDTLAALRGGMSREVVEIVNKQEQK